MRAMSTLTLRWVVSLQLLWVPLAAGAPPEPRLPPEPAWGLLEQRCLECHRGEEPEGELLLLSRQAALQGGASGPAVVPGDPAASLLVQVLSADAEPHMPPEEQLSDEEIATLRDWVSAGATWPAAWRETSPDLLPEELGDLPTGFRPVLALAFSPDEQRLAVARANQVVILDVSQDDVQAMVTLTKHRDAVQAVTWSDDGRHLATAGYRRVYVWDAASGQPVWELPHNNGRVTAVAFLPGGAQLVTADGDVGAKSEWHLWHWEGTTPQRSTPAHDDTVLDLVVRPESKQFVTASADGVAKVWDWESAAMLTKLEGHHGHVTAAAITVDGRLLATAGADREIWLWDLDRTDQKRSLGQQKAIGTDLAWSADGESLFSAGDDGLVRRFRGLADRDELFQQSRRSRRNHVKLAGSKTWSDAIAVSRNARSIYAGYHDGRVFRWVLDDPQSEAKPGALINGAEVVDR